MPRDKSPMVSCSPEAGMVTRTLERLGYQFVPVDCYRVEELPPFHFAVDGGRYWARREKPGFVPIDIAITTTGGVNFWHLHPHFEASDDLPDLLDRVGTLQELSTAPYLQTVTGLSAPVLHRFFGGQPQLGEVMTGIHVASDVIAHLKQQIEGRT
jgi:hypothetical protein